MEHEVKVKIGVRARTNRIKTRGPLVRRDGDPGLIRTGDLQFRKLLLYPSELRGHVVTNNLQQVWIFQPAYPSLELHWTCAEQYDPGSTS